MAASIILNNTVLITLDIEANLKAFNTTTENYKQVAKTQLKDWSRAYCLQNVNEDSFLVGGRGIIDIVNMAKNRLGQMKLISKASLDFQSKKDILIITKL